MRVLNLSVTAGQGHNQVAKNLSDRLEMYEGIETYALDTFEYINPALKEIVSRGYLMSAKRLPRVYGRVYRMAEKRDPEINFVKITNTVMAHKLIKFVKEYDPDVIVCTHVFAAMLVTEVQKKFAKKIRTIGIVTDFTIHPYWEETELDFYVTANEFLNNQAVKKGIRPEHILPIGIPISLKFAEKTQKAEACRLLNMENKRTVLVMSGSMGYGKIGSMIKKLDGLNMDFQIISVCGNNAKLKKRIDKMKLKHNIYNYGYTDKVDLIMDVADCIVTKPGGLTSSEALAKNLPMIMANPIPGQEDRNVEFFLNNGAALKVSSTFPIDEAIYQVFNNEVRLKSIHEIVGALAKPYATKDIVEFIIGLVK